MNFGNYIKNAFLMYGFKKKTVDEIQKKSNWFTPIWINFVIIQFLLLVYYVIAIPSGFTLWLAFIIPVAFVTYMGAFMYGSINHLFYKIVGGKGEFLNSVKITTTAALFSSVVSSVLIIVFSLFNVGVISENNFSTPSIILTILLFLVGVYSIIVQVYALSKTHKISGGKGFLALVLTVVAAIIVILLVVVAFYPLVSQVTPGIIQPPVY